MKCVRRCVSAAPVAVLVLLAAGLLGISADVPARAGWARSAYATGTVSSGVLNPVPTVSCGASGGLLAASVPITWTAPAGGSNAIAPQRYTIAWTGTAGSGSTSVAYPATSGNVTGSTLALLGTTRVTVTATYGGWSAPVSLQSRTITTVLGVGGLIIAWTCA